MKTKTTEQLLRSVALALRNAIEKKPILAKKVRPRDGPLESYQVFCNGKVLNTHLIAHFSRPRIAFVTYTKRGKIILGICRTHQSKRNNAVAGSLVQRGSVFPTLTEYVREWLATLCFPEGWIYRLQKRE